MTATLINGRAIADAVLSGLAEQIQALGVPPHLAAVCVGDDSGLQAFVRLKQKAARSIGGDFSAYYFTERDEDAARTTLQYLGTDDTVQGIFIELPLPSSWGAREMAALIPKSKDVDALNSSVVPAPAVRALQYVLDAHAISTRGIRCAVVGAGALVGQPIARWLAQQGVPVDIIDITTPQPRETARNADLLIAAAGSPGLVDDSWIHDGAIVLDYGYGRKGSVYVGDVDLASAQKKAGLLSPVPGGMGPLVIAAVLENLLTLAVR